MGWSLSRTGHARLPMVRVILFLMMADRISGEILRTALPKSFVLYVNSSSIWSESFTSSKNGLFERMSSTMFDDKST